jgi:hypothetical protein
MSMELDNAFTVPATPDRAWDVLLDVERIAPCMPGATVEEFDGEVVTGRIKVKVGPVASTVPPAKGNDSLNLVRLVGPAVLKRVVPVVAAVVVVALLGRRFRQLLRRGGKG